MVNLLLEEMFGRLKQYSSIGRDEITSEKRIVTLLCVAIDLRVV
jgi:hypothetical protein